MDQKTLEQVITLSTGEILEYDTSETWIDLFCRQVRMDPGRTAVWAENGSLTYEELDRLSDRLAAALIEEKGVKPDDFVAVRMGRVKEFFPAVLAIHKAGAAYMPIDLEYPKDRVDYMMEDSGARLTLTEESAAELLKEDNKTAGLSDRQGQDRRAYMIYTSGSTGKPKGVVIPHRALTNFVHFIVSRWGLTKNSRIALHSNFAFDAAVEDIFPALTVGGTVYIVPESARKDVFEMRAFISRNKINGGSYSTQFGQLLAMDEPLDVDYLCMGGEAMTVHPLARGPVYNVYGPTEFTVDATFFELEKGREYDNIPIGRPLFNCCAYIVNDKLELLPPGETGELCLAGPQLAEGYWKRPDLTEKAFTTLTLPDGEKVRIYRTGDLACWNKEGQLEFCGRIDTQVKLRGFRVELGEVESRAQRFEGIRQSAAEVRKNTLCLYYTSGEDIDEAALSAFMGETLADYMVPGIFMRLDEMPLNVNGKIDRKKLPDPVISRTSEYAAPENDAERDCVDAMSRALGTDDPIGVNDDFFELGGDSIKAIRLVSLLKEKGYFLSVADVMNARTARHLASSLELSSAEIIDQKPYEGVVEDTSIFAFFKDLDYPNPAYYNQSTLLSMHGRASADALQKAMDAICCQHDMLRAVIRDSHLWVRPAAENIKVEEYTLEKDETGKIRSLCEEIQSGLDTEQALVRLALIHAGERDLFFMTAHHTIVDGVSWRIWLDDLETAYGQAVSGQEIKLPAKTHTYRDYADAMKAYRSGCELSLEIPYWKGVEERMLHLDTSDNKDYTRKFETLSVSMTKEDTKEFLKTRLNVLRLEVNDLLLTALGQGYREVFNKDSVSVSMEGHGREELGRKLSVDRTIGWFTSVYPVVLEGIKGDAKADLVRVKETLHAVPNKGVGYNILAFVDGDPKTDFQKQRAPMVIFNYLGDVSGEGEKGEYFEPDSADEFSAGLDYYDPRNHDGSDLVINCIVDGGCFTFWLDYNSGRFGKDKAQAFAGAVLEKIKELGSFLNTCQESQAKTASDLGETGWTIEEFDEITASFAERGETIQRIYPLTPMQEGMLLEHVSHPDSPAYRLIDIYECARPLDEDLLRHAVDELASHHEVLRTAIIHKGVSVFRQAIVDRKLPLRIVDLTGCKDPLKEAEKMREDILLNGYDLQERPLTRFVYAKTEKGGYLIFATHHIITDGWCFETILNDLNALLNGEELSRSSNGLYEKAVREMLRRDRNAAVSYFSKLLEGYENNIAIPSWKDVPEEERDADDRISVTLSADITGRFADLCRESGATLAEGFNLAWAVVLSTLNRADDVVISAVTSGRDGYSFDVSDIVGLFINPVPVRIRINKDAKPGQILEELHIQAAQTKPHDFCALSDIRGALGGDARLDGMIISFENYSKEEPGGKILKPVLIREEHVSGSAGIDAAVQADGSLNILLSYDPAKYKAADMKRIISMFENYVERMISDLDIPVKDLPCLNDADEEEILKLSTGENLEYDKEKTWIDLFIEAADRDPDHPAVADEKGSLTYGELDRASDSIAAYLTELGVKENSFVAISMEHIKEFAAAVIGIEKAGAAYVPIDPEYPKDRIDYMMEDSEAKVILTLDDVKKAVADHPDAKRINRTSPDHRAYMIYTSGSTGKPKGVVIIQSGLRAFSAWQIDKLNITADSVHALHPSFSFDASVVDLVCPLAAGATVHILSEDLRRDLEKMHDYFIENRIRHLVMSTQIGMAFINQYPDIPLEFIQIGGEKLLPCKKTDVCLINGYGPTEFTVCSSYHVVDQEKDENIPIGRPAPNTRSLICDAAGHLLPKGFVGELCLAGGQLAEGYWNRPELTAKSFVECSFLPGEKMYRTGDLARYNDDGLLEYCGRIDFQVKLRGFRIELGEIENRAGHYDGIKHVAAEVRKDQLVLYYSTDEGIKVDPEKLKNFLKETLTDYMVPTVYIPLSEMPITVNGKINRRALPDPDAVENTEKVGPETETERKIWEIAAQILKTDSFGVTNDLVSFGLSSITAMRFAAQISKEFKVNMPTSDILRTPVIRLLAEQTDKGESVTKTTLKSNPPQELYPVTENQRGIIIDWEQNPETTQYNTATVIAFEGVPGNSLAEAAKAVVNAHAYLKTVFVYANDDVMQKRSDEDEAQVNVQILDRAPDKDFFKSRIRPFNLFTDRLYRIEIYTCGNDSWLFTDVHHTIFDGLSRSVLIGDIRRFLDGEEVPAETVTAYDFALYEDTLKKSPEYEEAGKYFDELMDSVDTAVLQDSAAPDGTAEGVVKLCIPGNDINSFCRSSKVTQGSFFEAAFAQCLRRITRQNKPFYVTISSGRGASKELMDSIGMFVKTLPVAAPDEENMTCKDYVRAMHRQLQESYARDFYPYTELVARHDLRAQMMFAYQGGIEDDRTGYFAEPETDEVMFPLSVDIMTEGDDYVVVAEYDGRRYNSADVESFARALKNVSLGLTKEEYVRDVSLVGEDELEELFALSEGERFDYDTSETWVDLFAAQAAKTPDRTAVAADNGSYTYAELNRQSDILAVSLIEAGVLPDDFVAVRLDRVKEFHLAVLAIHKAGAAYMPIDLDYPEERAEYMLSDSGAKLLLTEEKLKEMMEGRQEKLGFKHLCRPDRHAYMIYTSGSTGKPKGVVIPQRALTSYVHCVARYFKLTEESRIAVHANFAFDSAGEDLYGALIVGGSVYIVPEYARRDIGKMREYLDRNHITGGSFSTQFGQLLGMNEPLDMDYVSIGGEAMTSIPQCRGLVINSYGPTEFTVDGAYYELEKGREYRTIPIGRPLDNCAAYILDAHQKLLPRGFVGELCLSGPQLSEGYWNRPDLTEKAFKEVRLSDEKTVKVYRTGDLARYNEEGQLEYSGRIDFQVKLRGFRIELGEIESRAGQYSGIKYVAAAVKKEQIVLYYSVSDGAEIDKAKLNDFLKEALAEYMVPTVYMPLAVMPMTVNGKIDRKALPDPEKRERVIDKPENELQRTLCGLFEKVLDLDEIGINENFFELGCNSLKAAKVLMSAKLIDLPIEYQNIFDAATISALEKIINEKEKGSRTGHKMLSVSEDPVLDHNRNEYVDEIKTEPMGNVLLTGATGFLGSHVLRDLIDNTDEKIYCLVRSDKRLGARQKLLSILYYYHERSFADEFGRRIFVLEGDITDPESLERILNLDWHTVINCAACVKHFADIDFLTKINLGGVENLAKVCLKKKARLIQISTVSVAGFAVGGLQNDQILRENRLDIGQNVQSNAYIYTKYEAEKYVLKAVKEQGLDAKIIRMGNLSSRVLDGEFQMNFLTNAFMNTLRAYAVLGCYPTDALSDMEEMSYIDEAARAVVLLSGTGSEFTVFHAYNGHKVEMGDIIYAMNACGISVSGVPRAEFAERLHDYLGREDVNRYLSTLVNYDLDDDDNLIEIDYDNRFTVNALYRLGLHWTITDMKVLEKMIRSLQTLGFFDCADNKQEL
ncbi:MAG: amino acid adenylation domain-containing protein [Lachnospiraceae bacterium]|nr:amino acid adenylation domain-containing protein [Lachnospiraceae bacterium]